MAPTSWSLLRPLTKAATSPSTPSAQASINLPSSGQLSSPVLSASVIIGSGQNTIPINKLVEQNCFTAIFGQNGVITAAPSRSTTIERRVVNPNGSIIQKTLVTEKQPIGLYVNGVVNVVTFDVAPQTTGAISRMDIEFVDRGGAVLQKTTLTSPPWRAGFDVGKFSASVGSSNPSVRATAYVNNIATCPITQPVEVMANPFTRFGVQPGSITWNGGAGVYDIRGIIPYIPNYWPVSFQLPPNEFPAIPYLGRYQNRLNAGIAIVGTLNLDGIAHLRTVDTVADVYLMNHQLTPPTWSFTLLRPNVKLPISDIRELSYPVGPIDLLPPINIPTPFLSVPVVTFFGLIDVTVHAQASAGMGLTIEGYIKPLKPELQATLIGTGRAGAELGVGLRLLQGLADAGATARVDTTLDVPVTLDVIPKPAIGLDACLTMNFSVRAFASVGWGLLQKDRNQESW